MFPAPSPCLWRLPTDAPTTCRRNLPCPTSKGQLSLVVKYQATDVSNTAQAFQDNTTVMKALVAKFPELRSGLQRNCGPCHHGERPGLWNPVGDERHQVADRSNREVTGGSSRESNRAGRSELLLIRAGFRLRFCRSPPRNCPDFLHSPLDFRGGQAKIPAPTAPAE